MPTIVTFTPLEPPQYTRLEGSGRVILHQCTDSDGQHHRQRLSLGSVGGIHYLDALCLYCGSHFMWVEEAGEEPARPRRKQKSSAE